MALSHEQEFEMYSDVKVIKNNCLICRAQIKDHEKRLKFIENKYWIFYGIILFISVCAPKIIQYCMDRII